MNEFIMLDHSATTLVLPEAAAAMERVLREVWGNPSSLHAAGVVAERELDAARTAVLAALCGGERFAAALGGSLIFTSGGTESNNLAILGVCYAKQRKVRRFITTSGEHPSVDGAMKRLEKEGIDIVRLSSAGGVIDIDELKAALTDETAMVSIALVNNETGALYPVARFFEEVKRFDESIVTHCDAVQAFSKLPFTPRSLGADLVTVSAHKIGGPKGVGALYVSPEVLKAKQLVPIMHGGDQEGGLRPGTENIVGIAGFGAAAAMTSKLSAQRISRFRNDGRGVNSGSDTSRENNSYNEACLCTALGTDHTVSENLSEYGLDTASGLNDCIIETAAARDYIMNKLPDGVERNKPQKASVPNILSLLLPGIKSDTMLNFLSANGIYVSSGSACSARSGKPSAALAAFGLSPAKSASTIRVSLNGCDYRSLDYFLSVFEKGCKTLARAR